MSEQAYCYVKMSLYTSLNFFTNSGDKVKFWLLTFELCTPYLFLFLNPLGFLRFYPEQSLSG